MSAISPNVTFTCLPLVSLVRESIENDFSGTSKLILMVEVKNSMVKSCPGPIIRCYTKSRSSVQKFNPLRVLPTITKSQQLFFLCY
jgi:hypothetical protein